ncbi:MAG: glycosyltransferase family 1 protein [Phycisphaerae bacterium]|nr:glycosyltransferase family 1 protein [Phycisphaerae bacterium]
MNGQTIPEFGEPPFLDLDEYERQTGGISTPDDQTEPPIYNILFLCDYTRHSTAGTIIDHCESFQRYSRHNYFYLNPVRSKKPKWLNLDHFDVIVIHYSIYTLGDTYLDAGWRANIQGTRCRKVMFIQDEYRQVNDFIERMKELRIDVLYTCCPRNEISNLYPESALPDTKKVNTLTGYVPEQLAKNPPNFGAPRSIDVGYRGREIGFWLGNLAQEKRWIGERFLAYGREHGLICDISSREEDRIYGKAWAEFLKSCSCVLGTESGASVVDFTGNIEQKVRDFLQKQPGASFERVRDLFFRDEEGKVRMNQISPRVFESIACGTCLILFEGEYSGILKPWIHYMPLKKNFSNIEQIIGKVRDRDYTRAMAETAYKDVIASGQYSFKTFVGKFDRELDVLFHDTRTSALAATTGKRQRGRLLLYRLLIYATLPLGLLVWIILYGVKILRVAFRRLAWSVYRMGLRAKGKADLIFFRTSRHSVFLKEYFRTLLHAVKSFGNPAFIKVRTLPCLKVSNAGDQILFQADVIRGDERIWERLFDRWFSLELGYASRTYKDGEEFRVTEWSDGKRRQRLYQLREGLCVLCDEITSGHTRRRLLSVVAPSSFQMQPHDKGFIFTRDTATLRGDVSFTHDTNGNIHTTTGRRRLSKQSRRNFTEYILSLSSSLPNSLAVWVLQAGSGQQSTKPVISVLQDEDKCRIVRIEVGDESYIIPDRDTPKRRNLHGWERISHTGQPIVIRYAGEEIDVIWALIDKGLVRFG